jgi:hypothetical protein
MPSGAQVGDLAVCFEGVENIPSAPSGWTAVSLSTSPNESYINGVWYYKKLTGGDIGGGATFSSSGANAVIVICVDFAGGTGGYTSPNSAYSKLLTAPASVTAPSLAAGGSPQQGDMILWVAANRANGTNTVSRGTLLQQTTVGSADSTAVYYEVLAAGFSTGVTYSYPGTYNPEGVYSGWIDISR